MNVNLSALYTTSEPYQHAFTNTKMSSQINSVNQNREPIKAKRSMLYNTIKCLALATLGVGLAYKIGSFDRSVSTQWVLSGANDNVDFANLTNCDISFSNLTAPSSTITHPFSNLSAPDMLPLSALSKELPTPINEQLPPMPQLKESPAVEEVPITAAPAAQFVQKIHLRSSQEELKMMAAVANQKGFTFRLEMRPKAFRHPAFTGIEEPFIYDKIIKRAGMPYNEFELNWKKQRPAWNKETGEPINQMTVDQLGWEDWVAGDYQQYLVNLGVPAGDLNEIANESAQTWQNMPRQISIDLANKKILVSVEDFSECRFAVAEGNLLIYLQRDAKVSGAGRVIKYEPMVNYVGMISLADYGFTEAQMVAALHKAQSGFDNYVIDLSL